jgi:hypothetical protein
LTHFILGTNKDWLWDFTSHTMVGACSFLLANWLNLSENPRS